MLFSTKVATCNKIEEASWQAAEFLSNAKREQTEVFQHATANVQEYYASMLQKAEHNCQKN